MAITLQNLRDAVRIEIRDPDGIQFDDEKLDANINQAYRTTYLQVANQLQDYFESIDTQDIVANQAEYPEPANCLRVKRVELVYSTGRVPLARYRRGISPSSTAASFLNILAPAPTFDFRGSDIVIDPSPANSVTDGLDITFQAGPTDLVDDTDSLHADFKDFWRDVIIIRAVWACLSQIETLGGLVSITDMRERKKDIEENFLASIGLRALSPEKKRRRGYFQ